MAHRGLPSKGFFLPVVEGRSRPAQSWLALPDDAREEVKDQGKGVAFVRRCVEYMVPFDLSP